VSSINSQPLLTTSTPERPESGSHTEITKTTPITITMDACTYLTPSTMSEQMLNRLNGRTLRIPDLWPLLKDWPRGRHAGYISLKAMVEKDLEW
jgi:hypothetical protein